MTTVPTIHLNGTNRAQLLEGYMKAYDALQEAYRCLKETAPNGRDYYVQGFGAFDRAADEHLDRVRAIDDVINQLAEICLAIEGA